MSRDRAGIGVGHRGEGGAAFPTLTSWGMPVVEAFRPPHPEAHAKSTHAMVRLTPASVSLCAAESHAHARVATFIKVASAGAVPDLFAQEASTPADVLRSGCRTRGRRGG